MDSGTIVLLEGLLVLGGVLAFAIWQLRSVRRPTTPPRHAERQEQLDPEPREAVEREGFVDRSELAAGEPGREQGAGVERPVLEGADEPRPVAGVDPGRSGEPPERAG